MTLKAAASGGEMRSSFGTNRALSRDLLQPAQYALPQSSVSFVGGSNDAGNLLTGSDHSRAVIDIESASLNS